MEHRVLGCLISLIAAAALAPAARADDEALTPPLSQSTLAGRGSAPLGLRDATRDDRWLGVAPSEITWSPDSSALYFRYSTEPQPGEDPDADPWYRFDLGSATLRRLELGETWMVPTGVLWSDDGRRAVWRRNGQLVVYDATASGDRTRVALALANNPRPLRLSSDGSSVQLMLGQDLYRLRLDPCPENRPGCAHLQQLTRKGAPEQAGSDAARWLEQQQLELFDLVRRRKAHEDADRERDRSSVDACVHLLRVDNGLTLDHLERSPDHRWLIVRATRPAPPSSSTTVLSYANSSGYAEVERARSKVGEPQAESRLGYVALDTERGPVCESRVSFAPASKDAGADEGAMSELPEVVWWSLPEKVEGAGVLERAPTPHGPYWSRNGRRALAQYISADHQHLWIADLPFDTEAREVVHAQPLVHDHDDAWIGGPPIQANYWRPALLEWLEDGSFVFASERTGWSHLVSLPLRRGAGAEPPAPGKCDRRCCRVTEPAGCSRPAASTPPTITSTPCRRPEASCADSPTASDGTTAGCRQMVATWPCCRAARSRSPIST